MIYQPGHGSMGRGPSVDPKRCAEAVSNGPREFTWHQCEKPRRRDSEGGLWCAIHDPARVKARRAERSRKWDADRAAERRARIAEGLQEASISELRAELARRERKRKRT